MIDEGVYADDSRKRWGCWTEVHQMEAYKCREFIAIESSKSESRYSSQFRNARATNEGE